MTSAVDERADLGDRYGAPRRGSNRTRWRVIGVALVAALTLGVVGFWVVAQAQQGASSSVTTNIVNFSVPDDSSIRADIAVTAQPGTALACAIEAQNRLHHIVGWKVIDLSASDEITRLVPVELRTTQPADSILVKSCWIP